MLIRWITFSRIARQSPYIFHQFPNMIGRLKLAEPRHFRESDAVVDDPKQLLIGVALHLPTGEIRIAWVHPLPRWRLAPAIDAVAYAAIQTVMCTSCLHPPSCQPVVGEYRGGWPNEWLTVSRGSRSVFQEDPDLAVPSNSSASFQSRSALHQTQQLSKLIRDRIGFSSTTS